MKRILKGLLGAVLALQAFVLPAAAQGVGGDMGGGPQGGAPLVIGVNPIIGGTPGSSLIVGADGRLDQAAGAPALSITIDVSAVVGGTSNGLLYDHGGVVGNLATCASGVIVTSGASIPSCSTTLPDGLAMGTPASATLTNATSLPISTGVAGLGTGVATALAVNIGSAGAFVTFNGAGGTPSSLTLTNATGLPISTGVAGLGTGVAMALAVNIGSAGAPVLFNGAGGTPSSITLTNATDLPISSGVSGLGAGIATWLGTPSSANLRTAVTDENGTGALLFSGASNPSFAGVTVSGAITSTATYSATVAPPSTTTPAWLSTITLSPAAASATLVHDIEVTASSTNNTTDVRGLASRVYLTGATDFNRSYGIYVGVQNNSTGTVDILHAVHGYSIHNSAGTLNFALPMFAHVVNTGSGTIGEARVYSVGSSVFGVLGGTITQITGYYAGATGDASLVGAVTQFFAGDTSAVGNVIGYHSAVLAGTSKFGFYNSGGASNYYTGLTTFDRTIAAAGAGTTSQVTTSILYSGDAGGTTTFQGSLDTINGSGTNNITLQSVRRAAWTNSMTSGTMASGFIDQATLVSSGGGATTSLRGYSVGLTVSGAGNPATVTPFEVANSSFTSTGAVTTFEGVGVGNIGHATLVTTARGVRISDTSAATLVEGVTVQTTSGTGKWAFSATGNANSRYAGSSRFGGTTAPSATVDVTGNIAVSAGGSIANLSSGATTTALTLTNGGAADATGTTISLDPKNVGRSADFVATAVGSAITLTLKISNGAAPATAVTFNPDKTVTFAAGISGTTGAFSSTLTSTAHTITSASATSLAVGPNGTTNPVLQVDGSTGSQANGLKITGTATGGTLAVAVIDSGSNANLSLNGKGTGQIFVGNSSTGTITIGASGTGTTISSATITLTNVATDATHTTRTLCQDTTSKVMFFGSGTAGVCLGTSSARFKHDIVYYNDPGKLLDLAPVSYRYNNGDERKLFGFIAEDVAKTMPELVSYSEDGKPNSIDMLGMIPFMIAEMKQMRARITELEGHK